MSPALPFRRQHARSRVLGIRRLQLFALFFGVALFAALLRGIGLEVILAGVDQIGWGLAVVIVLELGVDAVNTLGWRYTFAPEDRRIGLPTLFFVRLAGTAFNQAVPSASVGGEPIKVMLLRPYIAAGSAWASVITDKLSYALAQAIFVLAGFTVAFGRLDLPARLSQGLVAALILTIAGLAIFLALQRRGLFAATAAAARRLPLPERWVNALAAGTAAVDQSIRDVYAARRGDFLRSVTWHLSGFGLGIVQIYLLLRWLALPADMVTCIAIEAFSLLIQLTLFLVPASLGVQEGGKALIFTALRLPAAAGMSVGIACRLTQLAGIALGFGAFAILHQREGAPLTESPLCRARSLGLRLFASARCNDPRRRNIE